MAGSFQAWWYADLPVWLHCPRSPKSPSWVVCYEGSSKTPSDYLNIARIANAVHVTLSQSLTLNAMILYSQFSCDLPSLLHGFPGREGAPRCLQIRLKSNAGSSENATYETVQNPLPLGWSEKHKSWKMQKYRADSEPRHSTDFRTIFVIMIGCFVSCEIGQTYFTESGGSFETL